MKEKVSQKQIMVDWLGDINQPLVSILCDTFNHENFIQEALDGFLNQKTNFPFEVIVHDDASTDTTAAIVKEYADQYPLIIKPILQIENQYSRKLNFWSDYTFPKAKGKYIAMCEGDDYWTDSEKIQKQVDFLENNSEYVISWTNYVTKTEIDCEENDFKITLPDFFTIDFYNLFNPYCTMTLTCLFRKDSADINEYKKFKYAKDNTLYALALQNGNGVFMNFKSASYRVHAGGSYSLKNDFFKRYSSYQNVREIIERIPKSRTKNIIYTRNTLLEFSAFEALEIWISTNKIDNDNKKAILLYLKHINFKDRIKFLKYFVFKKSPSK